MIDRIQNRLRQIYDSLVPARLAVFPNPVKNADCTELEVNNWVVSEFVVKVLVPIVGTHPYPLSEQHLMTAAVAYLEPQVIYEWGTHVGKSARIFLEVCRSFRVDCTIHSIDLPDDVDHAEHPHDQRGLFVRGFPHVQLHQGDGLSVALGLYRNERRERTPLFFLDGDHSYSSVKRELQTICDTIPEANVLVHDTFYQSRNSGYNIGPHEAIGEILSSFPGRFKVISVRTGLPGMTLLYRAKA